VLDSVRERAKRLLIERRHRANEARRAALGQRDGLPPARWSAAVSATGDLLIGGCAVAELAERFGTPLFVVDRDRLEAEYERFDAAFASVYPRVQIAYSYKTNPLPGALAVLHELGAAAEVISHFELWLALQLGVPPARIVLNGPGKGRDAIELAVTRGVHLINIDSLDEIDLVAAAARRAGRRQAVGVRVVTSVGWSAQFGLPIRGGAFEAFRRLRFMAELEPIGLHMHLGTGLHDVPTYLQAISETLAFAGALREQLGIEIRCFDLGGGFGVPTVREFDVWDERMMRHQRPPAPVDPDAAPDPSAYARAIVELVRRFYPGNGSTLPVLLLEPGRALSSSAQSLVLRVLAIKDTTAGPPAAILDGGKNLAAPLGYEWHELLPVRGCHRAREHCYDFFGPLCHPGERLFVGKRFPPLATGDLVAVMDAGAYFVPNQTNFSQPRPAAVLAYGGRATLLRERETFEDIVRRDRIFAPAASRLATAARAPTLRRP